MMLKAFHLPRQLPKLPKLPKKPSWDEIKKRPEILGVYAFVATGLGLGGVYAIRNGFKRMDEERHIFNVDDPDFWIECTV